MWACLRSTPQERAFQRMHFGTCFSLRPVHFWAKRFIPASYRFLSRAGHDGRPRNDWYRAPLTGKGNGKIHTLRLVSTGMASRILEILKTSPQRESNIEHFVIEHGPKPVLWHGDFSGGLCSRHGRVRLVHSIRSCRFHSSVAIVRFPVVVLHFEALQIKTIERIYAQRLRGYTLIASAYGISDIVPTGDYSTR